MAVADGPPSPRPNGQRGALGTADCVDKSSHGEWSWNTFPPHAAHGPESLSTDRIEAVDREGTRQDQLEWRLARQGPRNCDQLWRGPAEPLVRPLLAPARLAAAEVHGYRVGVTIVITLQDQCVCVQQGGTGGRKPVLELAVLLCQ